MKTIILSLAGSLAATTAFAGGYVAPVVEPAPVVAPVVPVEAGTDWSGFYAGLQYGKGSAEASDRDGDTDLDGYGVHAGYLHDFGKYVLGGELDYNKVELDDADIDGDLIRLRGRAGYDFGKIQPYLTLGVAKASVDGGNVDISETGITYGVGVDYLVHDRFSVGFEYTRNDFSDVDDFGGADIDTDLAQIRGTFRF